MALSIGDPAPDFLLYDDNASEWSFSSQDGRKVVLLFFPGAFTSTCTIELNTVNNDLASYEDLGADIVGISTDSPFALAEFKQVNDFQFPLLSDHDAVVSERYGAKFNRDFTAMGLDRISRRAAFVIDELGILQYVEVLDDPGREPDYGAIKSALAKS